MNFLQLHEQLRLEIRSRMRKDGVSAASIARSVGITPAHFSNFLNGKKELSLPALDRLLKAREISIEDLMPEGVPDYLRSTIGLGNFQVDTVPLVSQGTAMNEPRIRSKAITGIVRVSGEILQKLQDKCSVRRRNWDRFVAIRIEAPDSLPMQPVLTPKATLLLDRHYNSTVPYLPGKRNLYAVAVGHSMVFRYVTLQGRHLILSGYNPAHEATLLFLDEGQSASDVIVGRIFQIISSS